MDIAVCREVLTILIEACDLLGTETDNLTKWKTMLAKLPPYLLESDGTLKEWAWPPIEEHYSHRHVSHLYGVWPGNEIDPDRNARTWLWPQSSPTGDAHLIQCRLLLQVKHWLLIDGATGL